MTAVFIADLHPITAAALERAIDEHPALAFKGAYPRPNDLLAAIEEHPDCACVVDPQIFREDLEPYAELVRRAGTIVLWTASMSARVDPRWDPDLNAFVLSKRSTTTTLLGTLSRGREMRHRQISASTSTGLTRREEQIARAVCSGLRNKEIAWQLGVAEGTIKVHLHTIYQKLGISRRSQLPLVLPEKENPYALRIAALARESRHASHPESS